jgi:hypothetical protein
LEERSPSSRLTANGNKRASEKIADLLALASIDLSIPSQTPALIGLPPDWKT